MRIVLLASAAALALLVPGSASASTAGVSGGVLSYAAAAGEANDVLIERSGDVVRVTDPGATAISVRAGCAAVSATEAACPAAAVTALNVTLLDRDDFLRVLSALPARADGGAGNDRLVGGSGADDLRGGAGDRDTVAGGPGNDRIDDPAAPAVLSWSIPLVTTHDGGDGADTISVTRGALAGGAGDDTLTVSELGSIAGGLGRDDLRGGSRYARLVGGLGADVLRPGAGTTIADYSAVTAGVEVSLDGVANDGRRAVGSAPAERDDVRPGIAIVRTGPGDDVLAGGAGPERFEPGFGENRVAGGGGDDEVVSDEGADAIGGGEGLDTVSYAESFRGQGVTVTLDGLPGDGAPGEGDDVGTDVEIVVGTPEADVLSGTPGPDVLAGDVGADRLAGGGGADRLCGGLLHERECHGDRDANTLDGGGGDDLLEGGFAGDDLRGGIGVDTVSYAARFVPQGGGAGITIDLDGAADDGAPGEGDNARPDVENVVGTDGDDVIRGSGWRNVIDAADGNDDVAGLGGDDMVVNASVPEHLGEPDADVISGGAGRDTVTYEDAFPDYGVRVSLNGIADDGGIAFEKDNVKPDVEVLVGSAGPDLLIGTAAGDVLVGGAGADRLEGRDGADRLGGGPGADTLLGGLAADTLDARDGTRDFAVNCGDGLGDLARVDPLEPATGCETISR